MEKTSSTSSPKQKPHKVFFLEDISVSVFKNLRTSKDGKRQWHSYSLSVRGSYYDQTAQKRVYTNTIPDNNALAAAEAFVQAYHWIEQDKRSEAVANASDEQEQGES